ncbi:hypothetical protein [Paenarthrobacter histidinolovorans]|uniref:Uncharacterized protein n=1 Tax=Paenarthrobacter histidinolovorans TaxID=43664 RepID=A0ABW8N398_9MICC
MLFNWRKRKPIETPGRVSAGLLNTYSSKQEPNTSSAQERLDDPAELARRVELLLEAFYPGETADAVSATVIAGVDEKGGQLSQEDWDAICKGAPSTCDEATLVALSEVLGVTVPYLSTRDAERDERVEAQLELLAVLKEHKVESFRACGLGQTPTAEEIRHIGAMIKEEFD